MLQNRVDPFGRIIATTARGTWMGNRGVIHNEAKQIVRSYKHQAWIICKLEFKGRKREVMAPDRWTELFFLDEATAFSAGHRPCFECRRDDAMKFKACWLKGNPSHHFTMKTSISEFDMVLHRERLRSNVPFHNTMSNFDDLPDGVFVSFEHAPFVRLNGLFLKWTPFGYEQPLVSNNQMTGTLITPPSIVNAFRQGYRPQISETTAI